MHILVNGVDTTIPDGSSLRDLLTQLGMAEARLALECNQTIVPRSEHGTRILREGDIIEIVHAIGGG